MLAPRLGKGLDLQGTMLLLRRCRVCQQRWRSHFQAKQRSCRLGACRRLLLLVHKRGLVQLHLSLCRSHLCQGLRAAGLLSLL